MNAMNRPGIGHNGGPAVDPDRMAHEMEQLGHDWADKDAAASLLEETVKSLLAKVMNGYRKTAKSMAEAESLARAHPEYQNHLEAMVEARRMAVRARVSFDACKVRLEMIRTQAATERAAMSMR